MEERQNQEFSPIGVIHSPYERRGQAPRQGRGREEICQVEVFGEFEEGLKDIEGFSHVILIYWFHKSKGYSLSVIPSWDAKPHGLFATRSPDRPNPLGLSVVELVAREGNILTVKGLDAIDGTPLLDIKPYVPQIDEQDNVRVGWLKDRLRRG
ncbi:MAG: tRNA (N6-threonylcarbamoyladenosine(37)-N6)-methyltransferase TrmO [Dehalococcoidia bacterium]|nr:tRNA (N6-threonylcarbamoyladenosine(37)-N6)-methyltransferase TrmO [Dehalococcoidia bacterium]